MKIRTLALVIASVMLLTLTPAAGAETAGAETGKTAFIPGTYSAPGKGYGEHVPVTVKVTVDENAITAAKISGEEEVPFGQAYFETYENALIGRTDGEIDAMTQATMTRDGVAEAVGKALAVARGEAAEYTPGTYEGAGKGYGEHTPVTVKVTVDGNAITAAEISGDEEVPFGQAYFETYAKALTGRRDGEIDAMSQATMTRNGVAEAVGRALAVARGEMAQEDAVTIPMAAEEVAEAGSTSDLTFTAGEYTAADTGFGGTLAVKVTFSETKMESIEIVTSAETPEIGGAALDTLIPAMIEANGSGVDGVSGATFTSTGLRNAVNAAAEHAGCSDPDAFRNAK